MKRSKSRNRGCTECKRLKRQLVDLTARYVAMRNSAWQWENAYMAHVAANMAQEPLKDGILLGGPKSGGKGP